MHPTPPHARSGRAVAATTDAYEEELVRGRDCSIIRLLSALLERAHLWGASDIHLDPTHELTRIRLRVDGVLHDIPGIPRMLHGEVLSRIKILARLRTDEHTTVQDGRFHHTGLVIDVRVAIAPTQYGENAVLRLLTSNREELSLSNLGFRACDQLRIEQNILRTTGMILVTGPTGSGKTTTLYSLLTLLNDPGRSLATLEDPVEYSIDGVCQIQLQPRAGLTFAAGLRALLRQDPDIIMVGEIRDSETASVAINTALTGHVLLSTLHTTDALTVIPRLRDMGVDPYLIAATLRLVIAQRLVRRLCEACRVAHATNDDDRVVMRTFSKESILPPQVYGPTGCASCNGTGYRGRVVLAETLAMEGDLRTALVEAPSLEARVALARSNGMSSMGDDGIEKIYEGITSVEEVLRVIHD